MMRSQGFPRTYFTDVYGLVRSAAETGIAARDLRMMNPRFPTPADLIPVFSFFDNFSFAGLTMLNPEFILIQIKTD